MCSMSSRTIRISIALSVLLHILFGVILLSHHDVTLPLAKVTKVELVPASSPRLKKKIIVPDTPSEKIETPVITDNLASKDQFAKKEVIKRGLSETVQKPNNDSPPRSPQTSPSKSSKNQPTQKITQQSQNKQSRPKTQPTNLHRKLDLGDLSFDSATFAKEQQKKPATKSSEPTQQKAANTTSAPFSRSAGSGARFFDPSTGVSNYLPELPDGDLTLLNAKAHKYAVFIQRVALRVFAALRRTGWTTLPMQSINAIQREAIVLVSMSKEGKIIKIETSQTSGSSSFDSSLAQAAQSATDPNPPANAGDASGNITLEFHARTWARIEAGARSGLRERRWLYLGTGML